jgi:hypothetical protein
VQTLHLALAVMVEMVLHQLSLVLVLQEVAVEVAVAQEQKEPGEPVEVVMLPNQVVQQEPLTLVAVVEVLEE